MILHELEEITNDYFLLDDGKAVDLYFTSSFLMDLLMKKQKGLWERPSGGKKIRVPIEYDESEGGWYVRNDPLSSDDREIIDAVYFGWKHAYGNATIYRTDTLYNAGEYAEVQLTTAKLANAQKTIRKRLASALYSSAGDADPSLTGLLILTSGTATQKYGEMAENDLVSADGTKVWAGKTVSGGATITLDLIRTAASTGKIHDGSDGKPNIAVTTETLWNKIASILQTQQRFVSDSDTAKAGFANLVFEGKTIAVDDYCPATYMFLLNSNHVGFAVHAKGYFARTPWYDFSAGPASPAGQTMKIFWDGNLIANHRRAHVARSGFTAT